MMYVFLLVFFWLEILKPSNIFSAVQWKFFKNSSAFDTYIFPLTIESPELFSVFQFLLHIYLQCSLEINPLNSIMFTDLICMGSLNYFEPAAVSFTPFPNGQFTKVIIYNSRGVLSLLKYYSPTVTHDKTFVYNFCVL